MNYPQSDSDDEFEDEAKQGVTTEELYDPERAHRIRQMVQASSSHNVMEDDQVTDFVLRMHEKNQQMVESVRESQRRFSIDSDGSELDASDNRQNQQTRRAHGTPDDYPPGEAYAGDEMDEEDQIPSFDPKGDNPVPYGRLCCVACALVIAMVATAVLTLVFVFIADGEDTSHHHKGGFDGMVLPFAPSNLQQLCHMEKLKTFQGVLDCREPCMKAACCWEKGENGEQPVCWDSHPLECAPYESCINLLNAGSEPRPYPEDQATARPTSKIPVAPDGVKSCNPDNINSVGEVLLCEDSCSYGACCWKDDPSVDQCPTDPNCPGYKACEILNKEGASGSGSTTTPPSVAIVPAPSNLSRLCSGGGASNQASCQQMCDQATCCWKLATVTYTGPTGSAVTESVMGSCSHQAQCAAYQPCRDLPTAITPSVASTAQISQVTGLEAACNASLEGACRDTCNAAACCWQMATSTFTNEQGKPVTEAVQGSCSHRDECQGYTPCLKLPEATAVESTSLSTTAPVPEPTNLEQVCATSLDGACRETCHKATCCWKLATVTYTGPQGNAITESIMGSCSHLEKCEAYEPCKQLSEATQSHTHSIPPAPANLATTCATSLDGTCKTTCEEATCCWKIATSHYTGPLGASITEHVRGSCSHRAECVGYEPCQKLPEASQDDSATAPALYIAPAPANLDQVCDPAPEEMDAIEACVEYCDAAMCCWKMSTNTFTSADGETVTESVQGTCSHQPECEAYKVCSVLDDDVFSPHSPAAATNAPAPAPTTAAPGPATTPGAPDPSTEYTEEVIFDVCYNHETQGSGPNLCEQVCEPGACCYKQGAAACDPAFNCAKYEPCEKLVQDADAANGQPSELETACANTDDLSDCVRLCAEGTCCFTTDMGKTCDVKAPGTVCSEYTPCEVIYNAAVNNGNNR